MVESNCESSAINLKRDEIFFLRNFLTVGTIAFRSENAPGQKSPAHIGLQILNVNHKVQCFPTGGQHTYQLQITRSRGGKLPKSEP